jgi:LytS/YehU family sensor histidine kinase
MRFKDKFTFEIHNELTTEELNYGVPPMLIQPFVENAVLHGFKSVQSGGVITLRFLSLNNGGLNCEVEDNGVGRKATLQHKLTDHKSFGTKITEERLTAFRQKYGDDFRVEIVDKEENGEAKGTKVVLRIPVLAPNELNFTEGV